MADALPNGWPSRWRGPGGMAAVVFLATTLAASRGSGAEAPRDRPFEPFAGVVCRIQAESAQILKQIFEDGKPGPLWARVALATDLRRWRGTGTRGPGEPDPWERRWRRAVSGGKVLMLHGSGPRAQQDAKKKLSPCARIRFRVPNGGKYYLFMKADSWCCGCQSLVFRLDGGPERKLGHPLWRGWSAYDGWQWRSLKVGPSGFEGFDTLDLPQPFALSAGEHTLELVDAFLGGGVALDELVVARKFRFDLTDGRGDKFLLSAAEKGCTPLVKFLLDHGADIEGKRKEGKYARRTPHHTAARCKSPAVLRLLLTASRRPHAPDERGRTPLHEAVHARHVGLVALLLARGADPNARTNKGETPVHMAARWAGVEILRLLHRKGGRIEVRTQSGEYPLTGAFYSFDREAALYLIDSGADVHAAGERGMAPLHLAARRGYADTVGLLLEKGANVAARTEAGQTPLHMAAHYGKTDVVELLLARGADPKAKNTPGQTPLDYARKGATRRVFERGGAVKPEKGNDQFRP